MEYYEHRMIQCFFFLFGLFCFVNSEVSNILCMKRRIFCSFDSLEWLHSLGQAFDNPLTGLFP